MVWIQPLYYTQIQYIFLLGVIQTSKAGAIQWYFPPSVVVLWLLYIDLSVMAKMIL